MKTMVQDNEKSLHLKFVKLGSNRRKLTNNLLSLLPEIYEKKIYRKYAATIVEYAGKFGGLSKGVVLKRLRLEKYLQEKPLLKEAIKTEGVHKVALVASLATAETEKIWVDKLKNMSKAAVQELSKEMRSTNESSQSVSLFDNNTSVSCKAVPLKLKFELDEKLTGLFLRLKKKFGENLSNTEILQKIFEAALEGVPKKTVLPTKKGNIFEKNVSAVKVIPGDNFKPVTRYIPVKIKKHLLIKSNNQCSYPNCNKPAEIFHHTERFVAKPNHSSLVTLCKIHHEFMHNTLIENENLNIQNWKLNLTNRTNQKIDNSYRTLRLKAISRLKQLI